MAEGSLLGPEFIRRLRALLRMAEAAGLNLVGAARAGRAPTAPPALFYRIVSAVVGSPGKYLLRRLEWNAETSAFQDLSEALHPEYNVDVTGWEIRGAADGAVGDTVAAWKVFAADQWLTVIGLGGGAARFPAKLGAAPTLLSANRWGYAFVEQQLNTDGTYYDKSGGRSSATLGYAYNRLEAYNTATGKQGSGINVDNLPAGWALQPIGPGVVEIVLETDCDGNLIPMFEAPNQPDGTC